MSASYVIPGINWQQLLELARQSDAITVETDPDSPNSYRLSCPMDKDGAQHAKEQVGAALARMGQSGALLAQHLPPTNDVSLIWLEETDDQENAWLEAYAVSANHPEQILAKLCGLGAAGFECYSEHDDEYQKLVGLDDADEEDSDSDTDEED